MDWTSPKFIEMVADKLIAVPALFIALVALFKDYKTNSKLLDIIDRALNKK